MRSPPINKNLEPLSDYLGFCTHKEIYQAAQAEFTANLTEDLLQQPTTSHAGLLGHSLLPGKNVTYDALATGILVI